MRLDIAQALQMTGVEIPFLLCEEMPDTQWNGDRFHFLTPVEVRGVFSAVKETVWVRAEVQARVQVPCADCLQDAEYAASASMEVCFAREPDPEDPDVFSYAGHVLLLEDAVLGALWLEMPMRILCRPDCRGLCPVCGTDRNTTECACREEPAGKQPFSALASLLIEDEEV